MKKRYIYAALMLMTSSCGIYSTYQRPGNPAPDDLYRESAVPQDSVTMATLTWRDLFTDDKLQKLIEQGLAGNTDLRAAHLKVEEAEAVLLSSRLAFLPAVSFNPQGTISSSGSEKAKKSYSLAVTASWEPDLSGSRRNAREGARMAAEQSRAYRQTVQTRLIATIAGSYYTLVMFDRQLAIREQTAVNWEENVRMLRSLKQNGMATEAAVRLAEAAQLEVEASLLSLKEQIQTVENSLSVLLGNVPGPIERNPLEKQSFPSGISTGIPLQLLAYRPDIRQAEGALAQAFYATNEARSVFYPSLTLSGIGGWTNNGGGSIANPGSWLLNAVGMLVQPLFNRGTNIARLKISKAQHEEALLLFRQSILDAGAEVNDALTQWQTARQRLRLDEQQIVALQAAVRDTRLLMQYSGTNYLEVLAARQTLLQAELTEAEDRFYEIQGVIQLYHALGGGTQ